MKDHIHKDTHHLEHSHPIGHGTDNATKPDGKNDLGTIPNADNQLHFDKKAESQTVDLKTKEVTRDDTPLSQKNDLLREDEIGNVEDKDKSK